MGGDQIGSSSILLVDDDPDILALAGTALADAGFAVTELDEGGGVIAALESRQHHLLVLDLGLPDVHGLDVLRTVCSDHRIPIIILTANGSEADRVVGLELGADDYIVKPFSPRELVARVRAVLRRANHAADGGQEEILEHHGLRIDLRTREVHIDGVSANLTTKEFDLLAFLAANPRQVFTREQLLDQVWSSTEEWQSPATVNEHVYRLRQKVPRADGSWITTLRSVGYRFEP